MPRWSQRCVWALMTGSDSRFCSTRKGDSIHSPPHTRHTQAIASVHSCRRRFTVVGGFSQSPRRCLQPCRSWWVSGGEEARRVTGHVAGVTVSLQGRTRIPSMLLLILKIKLSVPQAIWSSATSGSAEIRCRRKMHKDAQCSTCWHMCQGPPPTATAVPRPRCRGMVPIAFAAPPCDK